MIRINLLPQKEAKRRRRVAPERPTTARQVSPLTIAALVGIAVIVVGLYYFGVRKPRQTLRSDNTELKDDLKTLNNEIESIKGDVQVLRRAATITKSMLSIVYTLDPEDRLLWSEKLNQISDLVPANVFITRLTVTESIQKRQTPSSIREISDWNKKYGTAAKRKAAARRGTVPPKPAPMFYPEVVQTLVIQAIAHSENEDERIRLINQFYDNLDTGENEQAKIEHDFLDGFTGPIQYGNITPQTVGGQLATAFSFTLQTEPTRPASAEGAAGGF